MSGKSGFHPCMACNANIPQEDKHTLCEPLLHDLSQDHLLGIPDAQAACSHSPSLQARRVKCSKQSREILNIKAQMAQVLELLAKQAPAAQAPVQDPLQPQLPYPPSPRGVQGGWEEASQLVQENTFSIAASGEGASFSSDMQVDETPAEEEPGFKAASEATAPPLSCSISALMGRAAAFLGSSGLARVPDADKAALVDVPISPVHTFGPAVEELLHRSHWESEASRQVATLLPPHASTWGRGVQGGWEEASQLVQEDTFSIAASGEGASFSSDMQVDETPAEEEPGFEAASEATAPPLSCSIVATCPSRWPHCSLLMPPHGAGRAAGKLLRRGLLLEKF
ncbi:UNVERIFIED_CONTAM: hypothetical protein FKN15_025692 [Acipenser sinensis]